MTTHPCSRTAHVIAAALVYKICLCSLSGLQVLLEWGQNVVTCTIAQPRSLITVWQLSSGNLWHQRAQPCKLCVSYYHLQGLFGVTQPHLVFLDLLSASGWVKSSAVFLPIKDESSNFWHVASKHCLHARNKNTKKKRKWHAESVLLQQRQQSLLGYLLSSTNRTIGTTIFLAVSY